MATRSESFRSQQERRQRRAKEEPETKEKPARRSKPRRPPRRARKATYRIEPHVPGRRPSRKSTRGGANRVKPDAPFNRREELVKGSPENRAAGSRVRTRRVRGSR